MTQSRASEIDWTACIICKLKAFKHDRKMHKVSSENRTRSIKRVAEQISDSQMIFKVTSEDFAENALYHSACITRYLLSQNRDRGTSDVRAWKCIRLICFHHPRRLADTQESVLPEPPTGEMCTFPPWRYARKLHNVSASTKVEETLWWCYRYSMSTRAGYV